MTAVSPTGHADTIDLADAARSIRRGWREVFGCLALGIAIAVAIVFWAPKSSKAPAY